MRLIDADKIYPDCMTKDGELAISQSQLANALTVEMNVLPKIHYERGFNAGYDSGKNARPKGEWIVTAEDDHGVHRICCPFCHYEKGRENSSIITVTFTKLPNYCENCGAGLKVGVEND